MTEVPMLEFIFELICEGDEKHHHSRISIGAVDQQYADRFAEIMPGTSDFAMSPPREHPIAGAILAQCELCGAWFRTYLRKVEP